MDMLTIYLFTRVPIVCSTIHFLMVVAGCFTVVTLIGTFVANCLYREHVDSRPPFREEREIASWAYWKASWMMALKPSIILFILFLSLNVVMPTQKELAAIILVPKVANSQAAAELQKVPLNALKLMNVKLQQYLTETTTVPQPPAAK